MSLALIVGCQQQIKPPVTEIPRAETTLESAETVVDTPTDTPVSAINTDPELPEQIDWNRRSREIARTELSPILRELPPTSSESGRPTELDPAAPFVSESEATEGIALRTPVIVRPTDETPEMVTAPVIPENPIESSALQLSQNRPESAIITLNAIDPRSLSETQRADVLRIKASAYRQLGMIIAALRFDAERLRYLEADQLNVETRRILGELEQLPDRILLDLSIGTDLLAGLAHALQLKTTSTTDEDAISQWLRKYRAHPLLKARLTDYEFLTEAALPDDFKVTVLLPLSGDWANAGRAIRDGILFEYQQRQTTVGVALTVIDSESLTPEQLIATGQSTDTEFVIGPLQKDKIAILLESQPRMPVLLLNRIQTNALPLKSPTYSLSLAVEDDAESTINQIAREVDQARVVVFHSDSPLGVRSAEAIRQQLTVVGGSHAGQFILDDKKPETAITQAFGVTDSENRRRELSKTLGLRLEHTPRIRQDMSAVVVHTDPKKAQRIRPLLDFYYLDQTPVYLIGTYRDDLHDIVEDLKNTRVMVTPWDLGTPAKQALTSRPLAQGVFGSLVGVGIDAMNMAVQLGFGGSTSIQGETGFLTLGADSMIHRQLSTIHISSTEDITRHLWEPLPSLLQSDLFYAD
ncbi:MAG: penicillin-binding protein activator [Litoricola sp.]|nr:penicillin-binding protein activator [Litorivicinus sp.]